MNNAWLWQIATIVLLVVLAWRSSPTRTDFTPFERNAVVTTMTSGHVVSHGGWHVYYSQPGRRYCLINTNSPRHDMEERLFDNAGDAADAFLLETRTRA